jgi:hypothetical protein
MEEAKMIIKSGRVTYKEWDRMICLAERVYGFAVSTFAMIGFTCTAVFIGSLILG